MKIVKILGGLGNQMFQYALYMSLQHVFPDEEIRVDISCFHGYKLHNGFELEKIFNLKPLIASSRNIMKVSYYFPNYFFWKIGKLCLPHRRTMCVEDKSMSYDSSILVLGGNRYFDGYWQNERYFSFIRSTILQVFSFPPLEDKKNKDLVEMLDNNSVSIHVRRGDYVGNSIYQGICDIQYYVSAIEKMRERINPSLFCIFSNDIEWCKTSLEKFINEPTVYVDWNTGSESYRDMQLMSCCGNNIIANSSFSWWGAWLNNNEKKVVIAPHKWLNVHNLHFELPESWIKI